MIDLTLSSGLPIRFDEIAEKFQYGEGIVCNAINRVPLTSMLPGLLNKSLRYPETVYLEHRNLRLKDDDEKLRNNGFHYDVLMLPSGLMGVEFIRSHIFYSDCHSEDGGVSEIVEVLTGTLTILLQKNKIEDSEFVFETKVSEGLVIKVNKGEKFTVPQGYYYTFINTKSRPVVFSRFYRKGCICDYSKFQKEQGLAYFAIRKNAKQEIVLNPRYREIPQIRSARPEHIVFKTRPELSPEPLYVQLTSKPEAFISWL